MEFALPIGDQVGPYDIVDGERIRPAITNDFHSAVAGRTEGTVEVAPPLYPIVEPKLRALTREPRKIPFSP
jgi:hypothetical protein